MNKSIWQVGGIAGIFLLTLLLFLQNTTAQNLDPTLPTGEFAARIYYNDIRELDSLMDDFDIRESINQQGKYALVFVEQTRFQALAANGYHVQLDTEATDRLNNQHPFFEKYKTVAELYADMDALVAAFPDILEVVDYGDSYCKTQGGCTTLGGETSAGYDLRALRLTNRAIGGDKPISFSMSAIHAREITTPEVNMTLASWLAEGYGVNADITWILDYHEVWVVPLVNPDGHWIVELGTQAPYFTNPFTQRKNGHQLNCNSWTPTHGSQYGIDLNRNHSFMWGNAGTSPCGLTYQGPSAASEPEVAQLEALLRTLFPDQRGPNPNDPAPPDTTGIFITNHSFGEWVLYPWGNPLNQNAPNHTDLKALSDKFASYNGYTSCRPGTSGCLGGVSGASEDWVYGELGVPGFTFELGNTFMPNYSQVEAQWNKNVFAYLYAAKVARAPYQLVRGPEAQHLFIDTQPLLTALIDDRNNGNQAIARAEYYIDVPPWITTTTPISHSLTADDGAFDSPMEIVSGVIDTSGLAAGQHIVYVRGMDNAGNFGPISAEFFIVLGEPPPPTITVTKTASTDIAWVGDVYSYTIQQQVTYHAPDGFFVSQTLTDTLPAGVTILPETIVTNFGHAPEIYDPATHTIAYNLTDAAINSSIAIVTFAVRANADVISGTIVNNSLITAASVDDMPQQTPAPISAHVLIRNNFVHKSYLPLSFKP